MSEKLLVVKYNLDGKPVEVTVERSTYKTAIKRIQMMVEGEKANKEDGDTALAHIRLYNYPNVMCATTKVDGMSWPITFDEFCNLPETFAFKWLEAINKVNPQWRGEEEEADVQEKK